MRQLFIFMALVIFQITLPQNIKAQNLNINPDGISGSAGVGFANFDVLAPEAQNFSLDQGVYASVYGEKGFNALNLFLTLSINYLKTDGQTNYSYTTTSGATTYTGTDVPFNADLFQLGLGLKFKLFTSYWFRPYVEAGGLAGFFKIKYKNTTTLITPTGSPKTEDSLMDLGYYAEGGLEISFSEEFGLRLSMRLTENETKELDTLANRKLKYKGQVYSVGILKHF